MPRFSPRSFRTLSIVVAAGVMLGGCATRQVAYDPTLTPAQNQLRQTNARFNQTVGEGAAAGALAGGAAGLALGGRNAGAAALIGVALGGLIGAGAGYAVARNNLSQASTEAQYNDAIQQAAADAETFRKSAAASSQVADQANIDAASLSTQYRSRQITQAQYSAGLKKYEADNEIISKQVTTAQQLSAQMRQNSRVATGDNSMKLKANADDVDASIRQLEQSQVRMSLAMTAA